MSARSCWMLAAFGLLCNFMTGCSGMSSKTTSAAAPSITTQPANQTVNVGQAATFSVAAAGTAPLSYQWQKNGTAISGATSTNYTTPATTSSDNGSKFAVAISNAVGSVTSNSAILTVTTGTTSASGIDVTTWHNDVGRTGQNLDETTLTTANVNSNSFGLIRTLSVDGLVDAEPLMVSGLTIGGAQHNVVFVVTENDSVYAFDADSGATLWQKSMIPSGETPSDQVDGCDQIGGPTIGITSTPVIDRNLSPDGAVFLVAMTKSGSTYFQRLHALDLTTGNDLTGSPVTIAATFPGSSPPASNGNTQFQPMQYKERAALLLLNGTIYTSWASHCDVDPYSGWIMAYSESTLQQVAVLNVTPNPVSGEDPPRGAIWASGAGPAGDSFGNVYFLDANGVFDPTSLNSNGFPSNGDFGNAFIKLTLTSGKLGVADYFTMSGTVNESQNDEDLGSGGAMALPDLTDSSGNTRHLAVGAGKDGVIYVVDRDNMGKFNSTSDTIYQEISSAIGSVYSAPAYFNGTLYYGAVDDNLKAFPIASAQVAAAPSSASAASFTYPGTTPSVSANGTSNGIVWAVENASPAVLHAYDASDVSNELYNSNQAANGRDNFANNKFITPMIANGKVFVGTPNSVVVFGLLQSGQSARAARKSKRARKS
jgi:hypothetical protein